jgi:hypothetical protein
MVLQNNPFDVINWDKVAEKFSVGVDIDNNGTVVGVNGSNLCACLDSLLPFLEVDRIGRLLGFGGHLDFKGWCSGQIV